MEVNGENQIVITISAETKDAKNKISDLQEQLKGIGSSFNAKELTDTFSKIQTLIKGAKLKDIVDPKESGQLRAVAQDLENTAKESATAFSTIKTDMSAVSDGIQEAYQYNEDLANSIYTTRDETSKLKQVWEAFQYGLKNSNVYAKDLNEKFAGIIRSIKRIAFYRLVRAVIQLIAKAIKESINNLYAFSDSIGGTFAKSMDEIKSSLTYFINSFATVIAPILDILQPIISFLLDAIATLVNIVGAFFQALTGASGITQATKEQQKYNEELKKTKSLSIDELNVLQDQDQAGGFTIFGDETERSAIGGFLQDVFGSLSEILGIVGKIGSIIAPLLSNIVAKLEPILDMVFKLINQLVDIAGSIISPIIDILGDLIETIGVVLEPLIDLIETILQPIFDFLDEKLGWLKEVIQVVGELLKGTFGTAFEFIKAIVKTFVAIITGDFGKIGEIWGDMCGKIKERWETVWKSIGNFFIDILNGLATGFEWFINHIIIDGLNAISTPIREIAQLFGADADWGMVGYVSLGRIPKLATGGIVEDGLFMANHNELIGSFAGGKTAVANNEQITQGIYEAVRDALQESGFGSGNKSTEVNVYLDSKKIAKQVKTVEKEQGVSIYSGAVGYAK